MRERGLETSTAVGGRGGHRHWSVSDLSCCSLLPPTVNMEDHDVTSHGCINTTVRQRACMDNHNSVFGSKIVKAECTTI